MGRHFGKLGLCVGFVALVSVGCGSSSSSRSEGGAGDGGSQDRAAQDGGQDAPNDGNGAIAGPPGRTPVRLKTSVSSLMLVEGVTTAQTFTISLDRPWGDPIIVSASAANPNVAIVTPETIEFAPQDMGPKEVKVLAALDDDTADDKTTLTLFSDDTGSASVAVDVDDTDVQAVLVSPGRVSLTEGRTETVTVRLNNRPGSTIVVTAVSSDGTKLAVSPNMLTFNATNFSILQTLSLTAPQDEDANLENVTLNVTSTGNIAPLPVPVEITDDDAVNLDVTPASLTLPERAGTAGSISVKLTRVPAADVAVTVTSSSATKATFTPATLTFTTANAMTPQTVQVTPTPDNDSRDENVTFTFAAAGIPSRSATVTIDDPDTQALQVTPAAVTVAEGNTATFAVRLALNPGPGSNVTINVFSQNESKAKVNPPALTFSSSNFSTPQMVTVSGVEDDDLANDTTSVTLLASGGDTGTVTVSVTDDDTQAIQLVPPVAGSTVTMQETQLSGMTSTSPLGVRLAYRPATAVTVALASSATTKLTVTPASVVFTPSNYATAQFVTLSAPHDNDMADENVTVTASATGLTDKSLAVQILDTDVQQFDISPTSLATINEGGPGTGFQVRLIVAPSTKVTASISVGGSTKATVTPSQCSFDATNFMTGCTVGVTGDLDNDTRNEAVTITVSDQAGVITSRTLGLAIRDPDVQAIQTVEPTLAVMEGASATLGVRLAFNPIETVTVNVFSGDTSRVAVSPPVLTFTAADYNMPKTVTVQALHDDDVVSDDGATPAHPRVTVSLGSPAAPSMTVPVSISEDDRQAVLLIPTPAGALLTMTEGATSPLAVRLAYRPEAATTVTVTSASADLTVCPSAPCPALSSTVTFSPSGYSTAQFLTLGAVEDMDVTNDSVTVTATAPDVVPGPTSKLDVTINDNDVLAFSISTNLGVLNESTGVAMRTLRLTNDPGMSTIEATIASNDASAVTVTPTTCSLSSSNWSTGCALTVTAVDDDDTQDESVRIDIAGGSLAPVAVAVATDDNDMQVVNVTANAGNAFNPVVVSESDASPPVSGSFRVTLAFDPVADTPIAFTPSLGNHIVITSANPCVLTHSNYSTGCVVTVGGLADLDLVEQNLSIQVSAPPSAGASDVFVNVRKTEDDAQKLVFSSPPCGEEMERPPEAPAPPDALPVNLANVLETSTPSSVYKEFCVRLAYRPNVTNTVTLTPYYKGPARQPLGVPGVNFTVNDSSVPAMLSFTEVNYFRSQSVRVAGSEDLNLDDDSATVGVSVVPLASPKDVSLTLVDNDRPQVITLSTAGPISLSERSEPLMRGTTTVSISLAYIPRRTEPTFDGSTETITVSSSSAKIELLGGDEAAGGSRSFLFSNLDYMAGKNLTVRAVSDADANDEMEITLTFSSDRLGAVSKTLTVNVDDLDVVTSTLTSAPRR